MQQSAIVWPERYTPGTTDNYVSNEVVAAGLDAATVWPLLADTTHWTTYYSNVSDVEFPHGDGPALAAGTRFRFATFGFPPLEIEVLEHVAPTPGAPGDPAAAGRLGWRATQHGDADTALDVYHAWIVEDLPGGRVRVLTQESQIGRPAAALAAERPNPMLNGHQAWLDGLVAAARR